MYAISLTCPALSHPSRGAWIEITRRTGSPLPSSRTPHGVRGLKYNVLRLSAIDSMSHPSRGAWIEILIPTYARSSAGRTPHGVRGLKYSCHRSCRLSPRVAPLTGCVDLSLAVAGLRSAPSSHPSRGAWIEIAGTVMQNVLPRRTPHGVRGLKFENVKRVFEWFVAPLTGCVD